MSSSYRRPQSFDTRPKPVYQPPKVVGKPATPIPTPARGVNAPPLQTVGLQPGPVSAPVAPTLKIPLSTVESLPGPNSSFLNSNVGANVGAPSLSIPNGYNPDSRDFGAPVVAGSPMPSASVGFAPNPPTAPVSNTAAIQRQQEMDRQLAQTLMREQEERAAAAAAARQQEEARKVAEAEAAQRAAQQAEFDRIKREREAAIAQQQQQFLEMQKQQEAEMARQAGLKEQFERDRAAQQLQIAGTRAASFAVTQSLRILSQQGNQGPTAAMAKRKRGVGGGVRTPAASLRIGSVGRAAGAGPNIAL